LGRLLHWLCAIAAVTLALGAATLAVIALLASPANAQEVAPANSVERIDPANVVWDEPAPKPNSKIAGPSEDYQPRAAARGPSATHEVPRSNAPGSGTLADTVEQMPDLRPVQPTRTPIEDSPKQGADWEMLQDAGALFLGALVLAFIGRGLRYLLANE
jgi:hypothetical protein